MTTQFALPAASVQSKAMPVKAEILGELTFADVENTPVLEQKPVLKVSERHHAIARLLACGEKAIVVSAATGYSPSHISGLQKDPMFQELLAHYQSVADKSFRDTLERMKIVRGEALGELQRRLAEGPENFKNDDLLKVITNMLDRSGHGPTSKTENQSVLLTGQDLKEMKEAAHEEQKGEIINAETYNAQDNSRSEMGEGRARSAVPDSKDAREGATPGSTIPRDALPQASREEAHHDGPRPSTESVVLLSGQQRKGVGRDGLLSEPAGGGTSDGGQTHTDPPSVSADAGTVRTNSAPPVQETSNVSADLQVPEVRAKEGVRGARSDSDAEL